MAFVLVAAKIGLLASGNSRWLLVVAFLVACVMWIRRGADVVDEDRRDRDRVDQGTE
jgi:hypothetical protein